MVSLDKNLFTIQPWKNDWAVNFFLSHAEIAKMVDCIFWTDNLIPPFDHFLVHHFNISKWSAAIVNDVVVKEMRIASKVNHCYHL